MLFLNVGTEINYCNVKQKQFVLLVILAQHVFAVCMAHGVSWYRNTDFLAL